MRHPRRGRALAQRFPADVDFADAAPQEAVAIDLSDLVVALEDHSGLAWYLDTKTGDVLPVPDDADDDLLPVPREELVESERFIFIAPLGRMCTDEIMALTRRG